MSIRVVATWAFLFAPVLLTHCSGTDPAPSTAGQAGAATTGGSGGSGGNGALPAAGGAGSANLAGANNAAGSGGAVSASGGAGGGSGGTGGISNGGSGGMAGSNSGGGGAGTAGSAGAGGSSGGSGFAISSSQHVKGAVFADSITCAGEGVSPPLAWTAGPTGTKSYAITFFDQTKLNGKPIKPSELLELPVRCDTCTVADELRKISKISICEHWDMSDRLVDDIRLRRIFRFRMVSDVLGR